MKDQPKVTDEITVSRAAFQAAIVEEIQDYFSGTDWQYTLECGAPLIARYVLGRIASDLSGRNKSVNY